MARNPLRIRSGRGAAALLVAALAGDAPAVRAEIIFLKNGRQIVAASATESGETVTYESGYGPVSIPKSLVERIERGGAMPAPPPAPAASPPAPSADAVRESGELPSAGIRLTLNASAMEQILVEGRVNDSMLAELARHATDSPAKRQEAVQALLLAAVHEARSGRLAEASRWAEEALRTDHFDRNALLLATQLDLTLRKYREALQHMQVAYGQDPGSPDVLTLLGDAYYFSEGAAKAIQYWRQAHRLRPAPTLQQRIDRVAPEAELERSLRQAESFHFVLSWQGSEQRNSFGEMVLEELERSFRELESILAYSPREPITVILYGAEQFANITRAPGWAGAVNDGKIRIPVQGLTGLTAELSQVLKHELTHSFIFQITDARCPTWFNEGLAQFLAGESLD
ncbi:MAG TPA: hypothetical protein VNN17_07640, partial [Terriglobia bacterium]|nr:hypothetical protein [Terriglobia bacterium]